MPAPWEEYAAAKSAETKPWEAYAPAKAAQEPGLGQRAIGAAGNLFAGAVRGAGSIGATVLWPVDKAMDLIKGDHDPGLTNLITGQKPLSRNEERRQKIDGGLQELGADPDSLAYKGGKIGTEVLGTLGVGGALAAPLAAMKASPALVAAVQSGGMSAPGLTGAAGLATRVGAGGLVGATSAGMIDPKYMGTGGVIGAALPPALKAAGAAGQLTSDTLQKVAGRLMQSAVKPTIAQLKNGDAAVATKVMLDKGINPNAAGVEKLQGLIDDTDTAITGAIANSNAQIDKGAVLQALNGTRSQFANQAAPQADLAAIQAAEDAFRAHPLYAGQTIPIQGAQQLKQGTYKVLSKKYGQMGSADTEAQKAIARGLKDQIAAAVPEVSGLNAQQAEYLRALGVIERRALMEANKNPLGLSALAPTPTGLAAFMADRSALLKSMAARGVNAMAKPVGSGISMLDNPGLLPYIRGGLLTTEANP